MERFWPCLVALALAASPTKAESPVDAAAVPLEAAIPVSSHLTSAAAANAETFEFDLVPYARFHHPSQGEFKNYLNRLGRMGFGSVLHVVNDIANLADDERFMMRSDNGDFSLAFEYDIEEYQVNPDDPADVKIPEWDRLAGQGKLIDFLFQENGTWYVVTVKTVIDGRLLTWSWGLSRAGKDEFPTPAEFERAAKKLARRGYMPLTIGFSADRSRYYILGIAETTDGAPRPMRLKFEPSRLSLPKKDFIALVNKNGRKGFRLAALEMFGGSPENQLMVFAQILEDGRKTKRGRCVLLAIRLAPPDPLLVPLNGRGQSGRRFDFVANVEDIFSPHFVMCDASQSTHRY